MQGNVGIVSRVIRSHVIYLFTYTKGTVRFARIISDIHLYAYFASHHAH